MEFVDGRKLYLFSYGPHVTFQGYSPDVFMHLQGMLSHEEEEQDRAE